MKHDIWITVLTEPHVTADMQRQVLDEMRSALSGEDESACLRALRVVGFVGLEASSLRDDLVRLWNSPQRGDVLRPLIQALARIREVPTLIEALRDYDNDKIEFFRRTVPAELCSLGPAAFLAASVLVESLRDDATRQEAIACLVSIGVAAVPALVAGLADDNARLRSRALRTLGLIGPDARDALPTVVRELGDPSGKVREQALFALRYLGPHSDDIVIRIARCLRDESESVRSEALATLQLLGANAGAAAAAILSLVNWDARKSRLLDADDDSEDTDEEDVEFVVDVLETLAAIGPVAAAVSSSRLQTILADDDELITIRCAAAFAVWKVCGDTGTATATLRKLAQQGILPKHRTLLETVQAPVVIWENEERMAARRRRLARRVLFQMGADAGDITEFLITALHDNNSEFRQDAIRATPNLLGNQKVVIPLLIDSLNLRRDGSVWQIIQSLLKMGVTDLKVGEAILQAMEHGGWEFGPSSWDIGRCREAIEIMRVMNPPPVTLIPTLELLRENYITLRVPIVYALATIRGDVTAAIPELIALLAKTDPPCPCQTASKYLGEIGPAAHDSIPHLVRLVRFGHNHYNRLAALQALRKIEPNLDFFAKDLFS